MTEDHTGFDFMYKAQVVIMVRSPVEASTTCLITHGVFTERNVVFTSLCYLQFLYLRQQLGMLCWIFGSQLFQQLWSDTCNEVCTIQR
jgi:hypothetical protein